MSYEEAVKRGYVSAIIKLGKAGLKPSKPDSAYNPEQLAMGIKVELEHTDDLEIAKTITKHHLNELPDYYERLEEMEEKGKKELKIQEEGEEPKGPKMDRNAAKSMIANFLSATPKPSDDQMHELAEATGHDPHEFEEIVYEMLAEAMNK